MRTHLSREAQGLPGKYNTIEALAAVLAQAEPLRGCQMTTKNHKGKKTSPEFSVLDNAHVNIGSIQRILGHENRTTTRTYLHSIGESEREAMRVYEREMEKSHTESHTK